MLSIKTHIIEVFQPKLLEPTSSPGWPSYYNSRFIIFFESHIEVVFFLFFRPLLLELGAKLCQISQNNFWVYHLTFHEFANVV
jgi:hypothetical protein